MKVNTVQNGYKEDMIKYKQQIEKYAKMQKKDK